MGFSVGGEEHMEAGEGTALSECFAVAAIGANDLSFRMPHGVDAAGSVERVHELVQLLLV